MVHQLESLVLFHPHNGCALTKNTRFDGDPNLVDQPGSEERIVRYAASEQGAVFVTSINEFVMDSTGEISSELQLPRGRVLGVTIRGARHDDAGRVGWFGR